MEETPVLILHIHTQYNCKVFYYLVFLSLRIFCSLARTLVRLEFTVKLGICFLKSTIDLLFSIISLAGENPPGVMNRR